MEKVTPPRPLPTVFTPVPCKRETVPPWEIEELVPVVAERVNSDPPVSKQAVVVHNVPEVGRVTAVAPVAVREMEKAPEVEKASAKETVLPAAKVKVPEPVEIVLPLMVAVESVEVLTLLASTPKKD